MLSLWSGVDAAAETERVMPRDREANYCRARPTGHPHGAVPLSAELNTGDPAEFQPQS